MGIVMTRWPYADPVMTRHTLLGALILLSVFAAIGAFFWQAIFRASHAPAAATALLLTLGAIHPELRAIAFLCIGVVLITVLGEPGRWVMSRIAVAAPRARHEFRPNEL